MTSGVPANERLAAALKAAGYGDEKALRAFARKLAPIRGATEEATRRAVYRWKDQERPARIDREASGHLADALDLSDPEAFYDPEPTSPFDRILARLDEIHSLVQANNDALTVPGVAATEPILSWLARDPEALPPEVLHDLAETQRRVAAEHLQTADRLDEIAAQLGDGRERRGA